MLKIEHKAIIVIGSLLSFWVAYFSCLCGTMIGCAFGIAMIVLICLIDYRFKISLFDWGKRDGKLIYDVDIVAMQNERGEIELKFLR
jgi:predicted outer membrane lipoprotein